MSRSATIPACGACCALVVTMSLWTLHAQNQPPRFQASVEVTSIDVAVVDGRGRPILDLTPDDFTVRIGGGARRVLSAEWVPLTTPDRTDVEPPPDGYSTNQQSSGGRLIVLVIDQPNIEPGSALRVTAAVNGFIDRLAPADRVAAVGIGPSSLATPFTSDRQQVKDAIARMPGQRRPTSMGRYSVSLTEALDIQRGVLYTLEQVIGRECRNLFGVQLEICVAEVEAQAFAISAETTFDGNNTLRALQALLEGLQAIEAPKTMIIVSEGFVIGDDPLPVADLERQAAAARATIYALQLDVRDREFDVSQTRAPVSGVRDYMLAGDGLAVLTSVARGALFGVAAAPEAVFQRIEAELSGYYLLGLESEPGDRNVDGPDVSVSVERRGVTVRARPRLAGPTPSAGSRPPRLAVAAALASPLVLPGLPLRVATFSLRGPDPSKVQLLIHADIGDDYPASRVVSLGLVITDREGRVVENQAAEGRLAPVLNGVPSALQYTGGASLSPGEYTLKLAVVEGDRVGTIEHPVSAGLTDAGEVLLSEFTVGGPAGVPELVRPTVGHTVSFGLVHGYVEAYGSRVADLAATFEIASRPDTPAILSATVTPRRVAPDRAIFTQVMPVRQLPPGSYTLRATISMSEEAGGGEIDTMTRAFEVAAPAVLLTSADPAARPESPPSQLFLPVDEKRFRRPFSRDVMSRPETLEAFRSLVAPSLVDTFDSGVALLAAGQYEQAETTLKRTISVDADSTAPLVYLAAVFAAAGHDLQAAGAWQTALIEGSDRPEIYQWLTDTLLRVGDYTQARIFLEEAVEQWPADVRFAEPLALLYATFGQGREAVRTLRRHLDAHSDDVEALALAVEWIYHLHSAGSTALTRVEDVALAKRYADAYLRAGGPSTELVRQWIQFLDGTGAR